MPEKGVPAPFGAIPGHFLRGPENPKILIIFLGGPLLLSTLGGAIGIVSLIMEESERGQ